MPEPTTDARYFDFDAAFADTKPIPFKLLGQMWELPPTVPAATILRIQRLMLVLGQLEQSGEVPDDFVIDDELSYERMCREMVGEDIVDAWLTHEWTTPAGVKKVGIGYEMLAAVTRRLYAIHTGTDPDVEPGKARRPKPAKKTSARKR